MDTEKLIALHPVLFHMADARNWASIQEHGLLSTSALLGLYEVQGPERQAIESARRPAMVTISSAQGNAYVRDQHPLQMSALASCLDGMSPQEWLRLLNGRVFFWPTRERMEKMLAVYQHDEQAVFEVDTRLLLECYGPSVELSRINSGFASTRYQAARRGHSTFVPLADFAFSSKNKIAEVTVPRAVPDIFSLTIRVFERRKGHQERLLWQEPASSNRSP